MRQMAVLLAASLALGTAVPTAAQTFSDTTDVVVVEVPVQVIRGGEPVRGLSAADFEVWDGRRRVDLTGFEAVDLAELGPDAVATEALPLSARRHFLLLFDLTFSSLKALRQARGAVLEMVEQLHPTDLVAVGSWSNRRGTELVQGFTTDRRRVAAALDSLGTSELLDELPADPLRMAQAQGQEASSGGRVAIRNEGRLGVTADVMAEESEAILFAISQAAEQARLREVSLAVRDLSRSMTDFAKVMRGIKGRKQVVWLSEGFDPAALFAAGASRTLNAVERMLEELRRADCVVNVVDIAGLRGMGTLGGGGTAGQDVLLNFAKGTGGELFENTNDLGGAMRQMLRRSGVTYVLTFQPEQIGDPESFHRLRVKVRSQPRGTRVVHRPGWYAPKLSGAEPRQGKETG